MTHHLPPIDKAPKHDCHEYPLREDFTAQVVIPRDMTPREAERLCAFLMTLAPANQCDGCRRGLSTRVSKYGSTMHDGDDGMPVMVCTKKRYEP